MGNLPISNISQTYQVGSNATNGSHLGDDPYRIWTVSTILTCAVGLLGNGIVIWLLGFCIKRNPFTIFVLNLSIADFGFLVTECFNNYYITAGFSYFIFDASQFLFIISQVFLTVISVDRCVSVFFPLWSRCHRPTYLSTTICAIIWVVSSLPPGIGFISFMIGRNAYHITEYQFIITGFLCLPLMIISSLMLLNKLCSKLDHKKQRKLLITVLVTVLFFLICSFPLYVWYIGRRLFHSSRNLIFFSEHFFACLNSTVNPFIYYLVGRPQKGCSPESLKVMIQRFFSVEELEVYQGCSHTGLSWPDADVSGVHQPYTSGTQACE